jgi:hypothetical protein
MYIYIPYIVDFSVTFDRIISDIAIYQGWNHTSLIRGYWKDYGHSRKITPIFPIVHMTGYCPSVYFLSLNMFFHL